MRTLSLINGLCHIASHAPDRPPPSFVEPGAVGWGHGGLEQPLPLPRRRDAVERGGHPRMEPGEIGRSQRRGFGTIGRSTGASRMSARNCIVQSFGDHAAIDPQHVARPRRRHRRHRFHQVAGLVADRFQRRAGDFGDGRCRASARSMRAARLRVPIRRAEPGEGRHEIDAAASGSAARPARSVSAALGDQLSPSRSHCTAAPATKIEPSSA